MSDTGSTPRRVAMVSEHASPLAALGGPDAGGQNVYVAQLAGQLAARGHDVTVYTRRDDPDLPDRITTERGFTVVHVQAGPPVPVPKDALLAFMPRFGDFLADRWRERPPDVVHAHFWMSGVAALRGAKARGIPVVQTYHALGTVKRRYQGADDTSPPERIATEAAIGRACRRVVATCADEVVELAAMGIPLDRISVVPCGVDTEHFAPAADAARDATAPRRLLSVGRLVPRKGFDRAVRALVHIPGAELLIAGGPDDALLFADPEAERLRKLAAECGVADRVRLLGGVSHDEMPALMSAAELVLSTPRYEPFGIVPIEAMACRTPVVATAVGGQLDTVVHNRTGLLVPPADDTHGAAEPALGELVRDLLADPERLRRYGAAGRERVLAQYTWRRVAEGVALVYDVAVADSAGDSAGGGPAGPRRTAEAGSSDAAGGGGAATDAAGGGGAATASASADAAAGGPAARGSASADAADAAATGSAATGSASAHAVDEGPASADAAATDPAAADRASTNAASTTTPPTNAASTNSPARGGAR